MNEYTRLSMHQTLQELIFPLEIHTFEELRQLREDSGTGPDKLPARILKMCARQLARPISILIMRILWNGIWPDIWREHWITPILKRGAVFLPTNYRGIHLTAQMSKVAERVIKRIMMPHIDRTVAFGPNQFAYSRRKVLGTLLPSWCSNGLIPSTIKEK